MSTLFDREYEIAAVRFDRGGEYCDGRLVDYLIEKGIRRLYTPKKEKQLNGVAE